jgi:hypothetical protein
MKRIVSFCLALVFLVLVPAVASAQDKGSYTRLPVGTKAPFTGFLLDDIAFANVLSRTETEKKVCKALVQQQGEMHQVELKKAQEVCDLAIKSQKERHDAILKIKNQQLVKYEGIIATQRKSFFDRMKETSFWTGLGIGLAIGAVTTIAVTVSR